MKNEYCLFVSCNLSFLLGLPVEMFCASRTKETHGDKGERLNSKVNCLSCYRHNLSDSVCKAKEQVGVEDGTVCLLLSDMLLLLQCDIQQFL